ncbi:PAS domain S-box protein [Uliginosibacterium sp. H1]|uniref:PAS domain S-box protein n=1 Tax=Uliginosibacterium sp. H1 TaxID=3114757 RepID=UPI002E175821|nr:PAS domain S-box protein [Uliginosibacterium sp. H1]
MKGLTVRRAVVMAVLLGVLLPALAVGLYLARVLYQDTLQSEMARAMKHETDVLALGVRENLWALDGEAASALVDAVMRNEALVRVEILDPQLGRFVYRDVPERRVGNVSEAEQAIVHRGETIGRVRIEMSDAVLAAQLRAQLALLAGMLALQVAGSVTLILIVLQRRLGQPLARLSVAATRLSRGELDTPIQPQRQDEIGEVESRLEVTRQALQGFVRTLEQKNQALEVDLRERMRVEAALRDREQRLRAFVEQSPLAVVEFDLGWHILDWNDAAVRIFGWRREEVIGRHISLLVSERDRTEVAQVMEQLHAGTGGWRHKSHSVRADGSEVICQWYNSMIRDGAGVGQRFLCMAEDITERQRADDELRRLATVVRLTTNLVVLTDAQGRVEWFNEAFARRSGYAAEQIRGASLVELQRDEHTDAAQIEALSRALLQGVPLREAEMLCSSRHGERYWVSLELQPIRDADGILQQCVVLQTDVTDRHRTTQALRGIARIGASHEPLEFLSHLVKTVAAGTNADAAYFALRRDDNEDAADVVTAWAPPGWPVRTGMFHWAGVTVEAVSTHRMLVIPAHGRERLRNDAVLRGCERLESMVAVAVEDGGGRVVGYLAALFAVPLPSPDEVHSLIELGAARAGAEFSRLRAQDALRHSEQKFSTIFQQSPIALALQRRSDGRYLDLNPAYTDTFGFARETVMDRSDDEISLYADLEQRERVLAVFQRQGQVSGVDVRLVTADGQLRDCQLHLRSVFMNEPCVLMAVVDVTPMRDAQRQVEELNASLEQRVVERTRALADANRDLETALLRLQQTQSELVRSEKLAALGSLVAGVAHELNTPIGNSLMVASTLRDIGREFRRQVEKGLRRSELDSFMEETDSASDILVRNLQRAGELIVSFKQVAVDQTSSKRRQFDLREVVNEIVVTLQPTFRKTPFQIRSEVPAGILLDSYPGPFGQIVANLLQNTVIHAFDGREEGTVTLDATVVGETVVFRCSDNGVGIAAGHLNKVFDPFFTTKLGSQGTGLGLNIVHNIVTGVLGGEISVISEPDVGTVFTMRLPLKAPVEVDEDLA